MDRTIEHGQGAVPSPCPQCQHPFAAHAVVAQQGEPLTGGVILCPEPDCYCCSTWTVNGYDPQEDWALDRYGVEVLREAVFGA